MENEYISSPLEESFFFFFFPNQQPPKESRDYKNEQMVMHPSKCASCRPECLCQMLVL